MFDYFVQNFSWVTFFVSLAVFILVANLFNLLIAYIRVKQARQDVKKAEAKFQDLQRQLRQKDEELDQLLEKRGNK